MKDEKILPFANETKKLKNDFKKMIDEMDDEAFIDMMFFLMSSGFEEDFDEEFENDFQEYESPFSGEMVNFKCPKCKKISAYPIEIVNDIYEATKKVPQIAVIIVRITMRFQSTTKLLTAKYLKAKLSQNTF